MLYIVYDRPANQQTWYQLTADNRVPWCSEPQPHLQSGEQTRPLHPFDPGQEDVPYHVDSLHRLHDLNTMWTLWIGGQFKHYTRIHIKKELITVRTSTRDIGVDNPVARAYAMRKISITRCWSQGRSSSAVEVSKTYRESKYNGESTAYRNMIQPTVKLKQTLSDSCEVSNRTIVFSERRTLTYKQITNTKMMSICMCNRTEGVTKINTLPASQC